METGNDISQFRQKLEIIDAPFFDVKVQGSEIEIWTYLGKTEDYAFFQTHRKMCDSGKRFRLMSNKDALQKILMPEFTKIPLYQFKKGELDEIMVTGLCIFRGKKMYVVENSAMKTLAKTLGVGGDYIDISSIYRDQYLAYQLFINSCTNMHLLGMGNTVMAVMKDTYKPIPQTTLLEIAEIGKFESYQIDEHKSSMILTFPEIKKDLEMQFPIDCLTPGIAVRIGEMGESSLNAQELYLVKGGTLYGEKVTAKHTKNFTIESFINQIKSIIFPRYKRFYAALNSKKMVMLSKNIYIDLIEKTLKPAMGKNVYEEQFKPLYEKMSGFTTGYEAFEMVMEQLGKLELAEYAKLKTESNMFEFFRMIDQEAV